MYPFTFTFEFKNFLVILPPRIKSFPKSESLEGFYCETSPGTAALFRAENYGQYIKYILIYISYISYSSVIVNCILDCLLGNLNKAPCALGKHFSLFQTLYRPK